MFESASRRWLLPLIVVALVAPASSVAAQAGNWRIAPVHRQAERSDSVSLTLFVDDQSTTSLPVPVSRLRGLTPALIAGRDTAVAFTIRSAAGTVSFTGRVGGGSGSGEYRFAANRPFSDTLEAHGLRGSTSSFDLYRLAIRDVQLGDVDALVAAMRRYDDDLPDAGQLVRLMNHDVDAGVVADFGEAGLRRLDTDQMIRLMNHDVDGAFVKSARAQGYTSLDADGLIRLHDRRGEFRQPNARDKEKAPKRKRTRSYRDM